MTAGLTLIIAIGLSALHYFLTIFLVGYSSTLPFPFSSELLAAHSWMITVILFVYAAGGVLTSGFCVAGVYSRLVSKLAFSVSALIGVPAGIHALVTGIYYSNSFDWVVYYIALSLLIIASVPLWVSILCKYVPLTSQGS